MFYREAISKAMVDALASDSRAVIIGQNTTTAHGVFGTCSEAARAFPKRVLEAPISETMLTGACVGLAMEGYRPILVHTRADFSLFSFEHLINTAAKFQFLHGEPMPFIMRCVVGHGWGQGPVHSQSFHNMLAQVPGLNVIIPALLTKYGDWFAWALERETPTVIFEPRRLYEQEDVCPSKLQGFRSPPDFELLTIGDTILDAVEAQVILEHMGISALIRPWEDMATQPRFKHPYLLIDMAPHPPAPILLAPPFIPQGVSQVYERMWYPTASDIVNRVCKMLGIKAPEMETESERVSTATSAF